MPNHPAPQPRAADFNMLDVSDPQAWARYVEDLRRSAHSTVQWLVEYLNNIRSYPVLSTRLRLLQNTSNPHFAVAVLLQDFVLLTWLERASLTGEITEFECSMRTPDLL